VESQSVIGSTPRYRIERVGNGYQVVGGDLIVWEETFSEASQRREELEPARPSYALLPPVIHTPPEQPQGIIYGPVVSRRLGRSLGVNIAPPGCRVCSLDCVYCEFGGDESHERSARWPTPGEVGSALANRLDRVGELDSVTISGYGEPTLHPRFAAVVAEVVSQVGRQRPGLGVRILTNGSQAVRECVRRALDLLDERIVKLDASMETVCRPRSSQMFGKSVVGMCLLRDVTLQSCFIHGSISNTDDASVSDWIDTVRVVKPREVQIYTINRRPSDGAIRPVSRDQLEEIACRLRSKTGIDAKVFA
jgi:wyosine [tRNA(Phe)-imidazoG37] synthetase (radical SAM superfamily)